MKTRVTIIQFVLFAMIFFFSKAIVSYLNIEGIKNALICGVVAVIATPMLKLVQNKEGKNEIYMAWIFTKPIKIY